MSISATLNNMSNLLDNLHEITEDLQRLKLHQEPQIKLQKLRYASILYLPESELTQELKNSLPKPYYAKITYHEGTVSKHTKTFQEYINQKTQNKQNPSL